MKHAGRIGLFFLVLLCLTGGGIRTVFAEEAGEKQDISTQLLQKLKAGLHTLDRQADGMNMEQMVKQLLKSKNPVSVRALGEQMARGLATQLQKERKNFARLFFLGILSAFFVDFSNQFLKEYLGETGYLAIYMMMFSVLLVSFQQMAEVACEAVTAMVDCILAIIPVYSAALLLAGKYQTAAGYGMLVTGGIGIIQWFVKSIIFPAVTIYFILQMLNYSMQQDRFSKLASFLKNSITWVLRFLFAAVTGVQLVQCLLLPATDQTKTSAFSRGLAAIPGIGASTRAVTGTVLQTANVLKNAVGVACMLLFVAAVAVPCLKIFLYVTAYQLMAAFLQPIAQNRVAQLLGKTADAAKLLLQALTTCVCLFLIGIALVTATTNNGL